MNDGIGIQKIQDDSEFITGDNPVVIRNSQGSLYNIFALDNIILLPINKKYLITIIPKAESTLQGTFNRISASQDYVITVNYDIEKNSEKWIIGSKDGIYNHLGKVNLIDTDAQEGSKYVDRITKQASIMSELDAVLTKNNGILNTAVINKILEASKQEVMKDDVNMIRYVNELKKNGLIS